jgi:hypothetical protein
MRREKKNAPSLNLSFVYSPESVMDLTKYLTKMLMDKKQQGASKYEKENRNAF